jgi:hypothetical protein
MGHLDIPTVYVEYLDGSTEVVPLHPYAQHLAAKELARSRWRDPETGAPYFDDSDKTQVAAFFELRRLERVPEGDYFDWLPRVAGSAPLMSDSEVDDAVAMGAVEPAVGAHLKRVNARLGVDPGESTAPPSL